MLRRAVLAGVVGLFVTVACAGPASACNDPTLQAVDPGTVGPGDPVSFTIINTEPGASWQIAINGGSPLVSGTASGAYVTGTFPMPDMGSSDTTVSVEADVTHSDIPGGSLGSSRPLGYRAPAATPAPAPSAGGGDNPPAAAETVAQPEPSAVPSSPPGGSAPPGPAAAPPSLGPGSPGSAKPVPRPASPVRRPATAHAPQNVRRPAAAVTPVSAVAARPEVAATPIAYASASRNQMEPRQPRDARVPAPVARVTDAPTPAAPATGARPSDNGILDDTAAVLIAVALIALVGGIGRMGIRSRRRRPLPAIPGAAGVVAPTDAIEAELQELLSEEAARSEVVKS